MVRGTGLSGGWSGDGPGLSRADPGAAPWSALPGPHGAGPMRGGGLWLRSGPLRVSPRWGDVRVRPVWRAGRLRLGTGSVLTWLGLDARGSAPLGSYARRELWPHWVRARDASFGAAMPG